RLQRARQRSPVLPEVERACDEREGLRVGPSLLSGPDGGLSLVVPGEVAERGRVVPAVLARECNRRRAARKNRVRQHDDRGVRAEASVVLQVVAEEPW